MAKVFSKRKAYGDAMGPLGFPMHSDAAREIETALKNQSADIRNLFSTTIKGQKVEGYIRRAKASEFLETDEDSRTDVSLVSTASVDRDFEIVSPNGLDWSQWRKNPIVTFAHIYDALPVGRGLWVKRQKSDTPKKDGWIAKTQYSTIPPDWNTGWFPDAVFHMTTEKVIRGKSIGFIPLEIKPPQEADIKKRPDLAAVSWMITKALILEYAVAPVQSNPDSLVQSVSKSLGSIPDCVLAELGLVFPSDTKSLDDFFEEADEFDIIANRPKISIVTFAKSRWTEATASKWLTANNFRNVKATGATDTELSFRHFPPSNCDATGRTVALDSEVSVLLETKDCVPELTRLTNAVTVLEWKRRRKAARRQLISQIDASKIRDATDAALGRL